MISLVALLVPMAVPTTAQVAQGATMTVLQGSVAVIRTNGSAVQPAPSGTEVFPGDEIRTLTQSGALITFFAGTEIELGAETILVVQSVSRPGDRVDITLRQVAGTSLSRVQTIIDAGGGYRVEAGGAVALVRGSELGVLGPRDGIVVFINFESNVPILVNRCVLMPGVGIWLQVEPDGRGGWRLLSDCNEFRADLRGGPWNALEEGFTLAQQDLQGDTKKKPAGQVPGGQVQEIRNELEKKKEDDEAVRSTTTTQTTTTANAPVTTQTTTTASAPVTTQTTTTASAPVTTQTTTTASTGVGAGTTVTESRGATVNTTRTTTAPVTVTTGQFSTTPVTVTTSQTSTVPVITTTIVNSTVPATATTTTTVPATATTTTTVPETATTTATALETATTTNTAPETVTSTFTSTATTSIRSSTSTLTVTTTVNALTATVFTSTITCGTVNPLCV